MSHVTCLFVYPHKKLSSSAITLTLLALFPIGPVLAEGPADKTADRDGSTTRKVDVDFDADPDDPANYDFRKANNYIAAVSNKKAFRAGAAAVDITPSLDVSLGGLAQVLPPAKKVLSPLYARAIVLDDGATRLAFAVCELCLIDTETAQRTKALIKERFGLPEHLVMISVAHTHMSPRAGADVPS